MKRSQSTTAIFTILILAILFTSFTNNSVALGNQFNHKEALDDQTSHGGLLGTWIKKDDPETVLTFKSDFTMTETSKEKTNQNTWSVKDKKREVCIGNSRCMYYEKTELSLFLNINNDEDNMVEYYKSSKK